MEERAAKQRQKALDKEFDKAKKDSNKKRHPDPKMTDNLAARQFPETASQQGQQAKHQGAPAITWSPGDLRDQSGQGSHFGSSGTAKQPTHS